MGTAAALQVALVPDQGHKKHTFKKAGSSFHFSVSSVTGAVKSESTKPIAGVAGSRLGVASAVSPAASYDCRRRLELAMASSAGERRRAAAHDGFLSQGEPNFLAGVFASVDNENLSSKGVQTSHIVTGDQEIKAMILFIARWALYICISALSKLSRN